MEDGSLSSLAELIHGILQDPDYTKGARSHSARTRKEKKKVIDERRFILRGRGDAQLCNSYPLGSWNCYFCVSNGLTGATGVFREKVFLNTQQIILFKVESLAENKTCS